MRPAFEAVTSYTKAEILCFASNNLKKAEKIERFRRRLEEMGLRHEHDACEDEKLADAFSGSEFHMLIIDFRTEFEARLQTRSSRPPVRPFERR